MGAMWDVSQRKGEVMMEGNGTKITRVSAAEVKLVKAKLAGFEQTWIQKVKARGIDGAAALKMLRAEVAAYKIK